MATTVKRVCVFTGSKHGNRPAYAESARGLAAQLVKHKVGLVYGGGSVGLMGEIARTVVEGLGPSNVLGIIPGALTAREISSDLIGDVRVVKDMHERKAMMASHADAFVAMPGGFGTLEELMEVITWRQLGFHSKPIALLNTEGFYDPLLSFFDHCVTEGFISPENRNLVIVSADPVELLQQVLVWKAPEGEAPSESKTAIGQDISKASDEAANDCTLPSPSLADKV